MNYFTSEFLTKALAKRWVVQPHGEIPSAKSIQIDSRQIQANDLFIAIRGERFDGHDFAEQALGKGAIRAVVRDGFQNSQTEEKFIVVDDPLLALHDLAREHLLRFSAKRVALTGSNGKTTTKELIQAALQNFFGADAVHANKGNLNNHIGVPLTAFEIQEKHTVAIFEMGMNHFHEIEQ